MECVFVSLPRACRTCLRAISNVAAAFSVFAKGMKQIQSNGNILVSRFMQCKEKKTKQKNGWRQVGLLELIKEAAKKRKKYLKSSAGKKLYFE